MRPAESVMFSVEQEGNLSEDSSRRYACDRCRGQKLRCERPNAAQSDCRRCQRAGAICITTTPARSRRENNANNNINTTAQNTTTDDDDEDGNDRRPRKRAHTSSQRQPRTSNTRPNSATHTRPSSMVGAPYVRNPLGDDVAPLHYDTTADMTSSDQISAFLNGNHFALGEHPLHPPFPNDPFNDLMEQDPPPPGGNHPFVGVTTASNSIDLLATSNDQVLLGTGNETSFPTPVSQTGSIRKDYHPGQLDMQAWFDTPPGGGPFGSHLHHEEVPPGLQRMGIRPADLEILTQLSSSATLEAARADSIFRGSGGGGGGSSVDNNNVSDDTRRLCIESTLRHSDKFICILRRLTDQVTSSTTTTSSSSSSRESSTGGSPPTILGSKHEDCLIVMQLITLYGSLGKLFGSILGYVEGALAANGHGLNNSDWCQHLCGGGGNSAHSVLPPTAASLSWANNRHLWVRILVETCVHLVDQMYRRMEILADSGLLDGMALELLNVALRKGGGEQQVEGAQKSGQALHATYQAILKILQESLD